MITIFDIDCIPLKSEVLIDAFNMCKDGLFVFGCAQQANHLLDKNIYVSPAFITFSYSLYTKLKMPSFIETDHSDVGGEFTKNCKKNSINIKMLYPTKVEEPRWKLGGQYLFGLGTTYEDLIYHAFEIRKSHSIERFISLCKVVLNE